MFAILFVFFSLTVSFESNLINRHHAKALIKKILRDQEFLNLSGERQFLVLEYVGVFFKQNAHIIQHLAEVYDENPKANEKTINKQVNYIEKQVERFSERERVNEENYNNKKIYEQEETTKETTFGHTIAVKEISHNPTTKMATISSFEMSRKSTTEISQTTPNKETKTTTFKNSVQVQEIMHEEKLEIYDENEDNLVFKW